MNCAYRGCFCWYCAKNHPFFICKYYDQKNCIKKYRTDDLKIIIECEHFTLEDNRNVIFKKCEDFYRFTIDKYIKAKITLYLLFAKFRDRKSKEDKVNVPVA